MINRLFPKLLLLAGIGVSIFLLFFVVSVTWIGYSVKQKCQDASHEYDEPDCVTALSELVADDSRGYRARNSAIWALGQLGDSRALPVLEKYYTGNTPDREPLNESISQYELKKAIKLTSGGTNLTAIFWR